MAQTFFVRQRLVEVVTEVEMLFLVLTKRVDSSCFTE